MFSITSSLFVHDDSGILEKKILFPKMYFAIDFICFLYHVNKNKNNKKNQEN